MATQTMDEQTPLILDLGAVDPDLHSSRIASVEIPTNSMDAFCYPLDQGIWSVQAPPFPLNIAGGIGYLVNPETSDGYFVLHDHVNVSDYVPDPTRAVVTFEFDAPTVVAGVEVVQCGNGVTRVEGFAGDQLDSLVSIGSVFGPSGDLMGADQFSNGQFYMFHFENSRPGKFFRFIIRKTNNPGGYALYRAFPMDASGRRIPPAMAPRQTARISTGGRARRRQH